MSVVHQAHGNPVGQLAAEHPGVVKVGRAGWFAKGVIYAIGGVLALLVAAKASGWSKSPTTGTQEASPTGAIKTVAHASGGAFLLWLLAIGMLLYAVWRLISAFLPGSTDAKGWIKRIGYVVSAVIYTTFAFAAISLARNPAKQKDGNSQVTKISGGVMAHTGGRLLIGAVGVIIIGAGLYRIVKGLKQDINDELDLSGVSGERLKWTERLGRVGEFGRGLGIALVGFFLLRSAITYDANQATGLDGALRRLATQNWGLIVVIVVGIGFLAYGAFCLATFTHRRLEAP